MSEDKQNCVACGNEITQDEVSRGLHEMMHLLLDALRTMPPQYGMTAMTHLLVCHAPFEKEQFLQSMSDSWDALREE